MENNDTYREHINEMMQGLEEEYIKVPSEKYNKMEDKLDKMSICLNEIKEICDIQIENLDKRELGTLLEEVKEYIKELDKEI
jgi:uncharacterized protein YgfB (UPF0149 family)